MVIIAPHIDGLTREPVPMREEMEHILAGPLALIHIITVLRKTRQVDDAEITAACRISVRRRFSDVIETGPDKLASHKVVMLHHIPGFLVGTAPRSMHVVVCRTHKRWVGIRQPPFLRCRIDMVTRHHVIAAGLQGRNTFRKDERLVREVLGHILHPLMMVVETDDIDGTALEEMVLRVRFVATSRNRTRAPRVVLLHQLGKMLRQERVHAQFIAMCQG